MITLNVEVTEYNVFPEKKNTRNIFFIHKDSLVINFCDEDGKLLHQSEISIDDARTLSKLINL